MTPSETKVIPIEDYTLQEFQRLSRLSGQEARNEYARLIRSGARLSPEMIMKNYGWREDLKGRRRFIGYF